MGAIKVIVIAALAFCMPIGGLQAQSKTLTLPSGQFRNSGVQRMAPVQIQRITPDISVANAIMTDHESFRSATFEISTLTSIPPGTMIRAKVEEFLGVACTIVFSPEEICSANWPTYHGCAGSAAAHETIINLPTELAAGLTFPMAVTWPVPPGERGLHRLTVSLHTGSWTHDSHCQRVSGE